MKNIRDALRPAVEKIARCRGIAIDKALDIIQESLANYGDPFAEELDQVLENPPEFTPTQEKVEEKLDKKSASEPMMELKDKSPQEKLEEKSEEKQEESQELSEEFEEEAKEEVDEKKEEIKEEAKEEKAQEAETAPSPDDPSITASVRSRISAIAVQVQQTNPDLARRILAASGVDITGILQNLVKSEYRQRDLYEAYDYLLNGMASPAIQEHLREHLEQEMEHIRVLHRYLTSMKTVPTLERLPIPALEKLDMTGILKADLILEKEAVENYTKAIAELEGLEEYTALRVDLENILIAEMEHFQDIERWLKEDVLSSVEASTPKQVANLALRKYLSGKFFQSVPSISIGCVLRQMGFPEVKNIVIEADSPRGKYTQKFGPNAINIYWQKFPSGRYKVDAHLS